MISEIEIDTVDGVQCIRFARPDKKNALTGPMYEAMTQALEAGDWSDEVAAHVFLGSPGVFTSGNDLKEFLAFAQSGGLGAPVLRFLRALAGARKPVLAAVDGLAIGIGTTLLFHCDLVYASTNASFKTPFLDLGLVPEAASSLLMPRVMGPQRAFEMLCLGEAFNAERALAAGFVNAITLPDAVEQTAIAAARRLAARPAGALEAARRLLRGAPDEILARIDEEAAIFAERLGSAEAREAFTAFLEKRPPDFARLRGKE